MDTTHSRRTAATQRSHTGSLLTLSIAGTWIGFGLLAKVLDLVPRHQEIVGRILGSAHAVEITRAIGMAEILLGLWVLSGIARRRVALLQIVLVLSMNALEVALAPDLLLWGPFNLLFAGLFAGLVYLNEWKLTPGDHR